MQSNKQNQIVDLTFSFSLKLIKYCTILNLERKYQISNQLFKSGTSTGANVREAQNAESLADFIHKIKIAAKEADETDYWLQLCKKSEGYIDPGELCSEINSIQKILSKIISTCKKK